MKLLKVIFCRHEFWWEATTTFEDKDHELLIIDCYCSKCGKRKSIKFKKRLYKE